MKQPTFLFFALTLLIGFYSYSAELQVIAKETITEERSVENQLVLLKDELIATACKVKILLEQSGTCLFSEPKELFQNHNEAGASIDSVVFSNDQRKALFVSREKAYLIDLTREEDTGKSPILLELSMEEGKGEITSASFSPDGKHILTISDSISPYYGVTRLWNRVTGEFIQFCDKEERESHIKVAGFCPDKETIFTGDGSTLRLWDSKTGALKLRKKLSLGIFSSGITAWGPVPNTVICKGPVGTVLIWDYTTDICVTTFPEEARYDSISLDEGNSTCITAYICEETPHIWNVATGEKIFSLEAHAERSSAVALNDKGTIAVALSSDSISLWGVQTKSRLGVTKGINVSTCAALSSDLKTLLVGTFCGSLYALKITIVPDIPAEQARDLVKELLVKLWPLAGTSANEEKLLSLLSETDSESF